MTSTEEKTETSQVTEANIGFQGVVDRYNLVTVDSNHEVVHLINKSIIIETKSIVFQD